MDVLNSIRSSIKIQAVALKSLESQISGEYAKAIRCLLNCRGKIVVTGVGKSGIVGVKMAASLASLGSPSVFIHSTEAIHGDSGVIEQQDVVILISNSGETKEVLSVVPIVARIGSSRIAITSNKSSTLAKLCDVVLCYKYEREADHLELAPTTSAMLTMAIGDALAITLSQLKGFDRQDFHLYHPGGNLGAHLSSLSD